MQTREGPRQHRTVAQIAGRRAAAQAEGRLPLGAGGEEELATFVCGTALRCAAREVVVKAGGAERSERADNGQRPPSRRMAIASSGGDSHWADHIVGAAMAASIEGVVLDGFEPRRKLPWFPGD